jgi:hypothetical protein
VDGSRPAPLAAAAAADVATQREAAALQALQKS